MRTHNLTHIRARDYPVTGPGTSGYSICLACKLCRFHAGFFHHVASMLHPGRLHSTLAAQYRQQYQYLHRFEPFAKRMARAIIEFHNDCNKLAGKIG